MPDESMNAHSVRSMMTGRRPCWIALITGSSRSSTVAISMSPSISTTYGIPVVVASGTRTSKALPPPTGGVDSDGSEPTRLPIRPPDVLKSKAYSRSPSVRPLTSLLPVSRAQSKDLDSEARIVDLGVTGEPHDPPARGALDGGRKGRSDRLLELLPHVPHGVGASVLDQELLVGEELEVVQDHDHGVVHDVGQRAAGGAAV